MFSTKRLHLTTRSFKYSLTEASMAGLKWTKMLNTVNITLYTGCFHMSHLVIVKLRQACSVLPFTSIASPSHVEQTVSRMVTPAVVEFQRLNCCVWQEHTPNSITQNLTLSELINSGSTITNNYRVNFHLLLPNDFFCVLKGLYKWICVKSCLFFHWVHDRLIPEHFKVFTGTSHNRISLRTRPEIKARGCCRHKYGNNMTQWEHRV